MGGSAKGIHSIFAECHFIFFVPSRFSYALLPPLLFFFLTPIHIISTGKKASIWGDEVTFPDEFSPNLTHDRRGILSMANRGPNTNKSQFFILYDAQPHLNNLHTVFGQVLDGWDVLDRWERLPNAHKTTPAEPPEITGFTIHANPLADEGITFPTPTGPPKKA